MKKLIVIIGALFLVACSSTGVGDIEDSRVTVVETNTFDITLESGSSLTLITDNSGNILDCSRVEDNDTNTECTQTDMIEIVGKLDDTIASII